MDIVKYNRLAWDKLVKSGNQWTVPVTSAIIEAAKRGEWEIVLTPEKKVPRDWFGNIQGANVLCLAGGGGQQGPVLAAAGAQVTVFDNSASQLGQDEWVAQREGLEIRCVQGDMADLAAFANASFDLIVHPCSNGFVPDVNPVWQEASRVLKPGGRIMSGFINPIFFLFDYWEMEKGNLEVKYAIPFSDSKHLPASKVKELMELGEPLEYGHSLEDQIGGQLRAGLSLVGFYEDKWDAAPVGLLSRYIDSMMATLCQKNPV
ncbi:MAG: class I SAM-dependent methyltransferase [Pirellulaceae bacterium]|nr:class I SAM-dependent methyltransferase [Pirellulaceae bacterium]